MKTSTQIVGGTSVPAQSPARSVARSGRALDFVTLTKPRLNLLVLLTTLAGLYLASPDGVALALAGAHAGRHGARGRRRRGAEPGVGARDRSPHAPHQRAAAAARPAGRRRRHVVRRAACRRWSRGAGARRELAAAAVAAATLVSYVLVYTPLKTRTSLATLVGAVPGALPPVIGWAAATGDITLPALVLFGIVFFWQMPHFLAIAWMYRDDYASAGIPLLPVLEPDGRRTGQQALLYAAALWPVSLLPALVGLAGAPYSAVATSLGFVFIWLSVRLRARSLARVRAATVPVLDHLSAAAARSTRRRSAVALKKLPSSNSQLPKVFPW